MVGGALVSTDSTVLGVDVRFQGEKRKGEEGREIREGGKEKEI